jgi:hypothetical protein
MKRTSRSGPPKQKFTAPGSGISPIGAPPASKTWTPLPEEEYTRPAASTLIPSG